MGPSRSHAATSRRPLQQVSVQRCPCSATRRARLSALDPHSPAGYNNRLPVRPNTTDPNMASYQLTSPYSQSRSAAISSDIRQTTDNFFSGDSPSRTSGVKEAGNSGELSAMMHQMNQQSAIRNLTIKRPFGAGSLCSPLPCRGTDGRCNNGAEKFGSAAAAAVASYKVSRPQRVHTGAKLDANGCHAASIARRMRELFAQLRGYFGAFADGCFESCRGHPCFRSSLVFRVIPLKGSIRLLVGAWSMSQ